MSTYVDTSAILAVLDADDPNHQPAKEAWSELVESGEPLVTSNYVVVETASVLHKRFGLSSVRLLQSDIVPVLDIEWIDEQLHDAAMGALLAGSRHGPTLVDCVGFEVIRKQAIQRVFAYDRHFQNRGFDLVE